uniref:Putative ixoderin b5 n=1 Tax=Ixodes ricinus TaxID=34613 RepID=A0A6B0V6K7_IXORI
MESSFRRVPEITERQDGPRKTYMLFDPCDTNKPGNRIVSCSQIQRKKNSTSGVYTIHPLNNPVNVRCDMTSDGGGWTVIQSRTKGDPRDAFDRSYQEYEKGFGSPKKSFWIGNRHLHALTSFPNNQQALRVELTRNEGEKPIVLHYRKFHVGGKQKEYKLTIGEYDGLPGYNALSYHNGEKFTAKSWEEVRDGDSCSGRLSGGWWFKGCSGSNLNGLHSTQSPSNPSIRAFGITWHIKDKDESYRYTYHKVEMKIRDADFDFCTGSLKS